MSEIIAIHVGGAGVQTGLHYWETFGKQRQIIKKENPETKFHFDKFYCENRKGETIPRAIFIDTDARSKDNVLASKINFKSSAIIGSGRSCRNLFSQGHYLSGADLNQTLENQIRKQVQKCQRLSGFIVTQSAVGGAGSGIGANVGAKLRENYCDSIVQSFRIFPGCDANKQYQNLDPLQVYNAILSTHYEIDQTDIIYCLQNSMTESILQRKGIIHSQYGLINKYYAECLNEHVSWYYSPGQLNTNPRKRGVNLVPFPRIKHICIGMSSKGQKNYIDSGLSAKNRLMYHKTQNDSYLFAVSANVRDEWASQNQIQEGVGNWMTKTNTKFVQWLPNCLMISMGKTTSLNGSRAYTLRNGRNNIDWISKYAALFTGQFRRKAFLHYYTADGMDEMEFTEAESNSNDLVSEYIPYCGYYDPEDQEQVQ